jgi:hypothetical protein
MQKYIRRLIAQRKAQLLRDKRNYTVVQAMLRGRLARKLLRTSLRAARVIQIVSNAFLAVVRAARRDGATQMQRVVRGKLARHMLARALDVSCRAMIHHHTARLTIKHGRHVCLNTANTALSLLSSLFSLLFIQAVRLLQKRGRGHTVRTRRWGACGGVKRIRALSAKVTALSAKYNDLDKKLTRSKKTSFQLLADVLRVPRADVLGDYKHHTDKVMVHLWAKTKGKNDKDVWWTGEITNTVNGGNKSERGSVDITWELKDSRPYDHIQTNFCLKDQPLAWGHVAPVNPPHSHPELTT